MADREHNGAIAATASPRHRRYDETISRFVALTDLTPRSSNRGLGRVLIVALLALAAILAGPLRSAAASPSPASSASARGMLGPGGFSTGLDDDASFETASSSVTWLGRARGVGAGWVRLGVRWNDIAPQQLTRGFNAADPAARGYHWATIDMAVRNAMANHEHVLLMMFGAPPWADPKSAPSGTQAGVWRPNAAEFGAFAHAVAKRYSGTFPDPQHRGAKLPKVTYFQAWNEPNLPLYLQPQWTRTSTGWTPASPGIYRGLLNAAYAGVKAVQPQAVVMAAGTAPYGDPPGVNRMAPVTFDEQLMCLSASLHKLPCPQRAHFDAFDHHPYSAKPSNKAQLPDDVAIPDLGKLQRIAAAAVRLRTVLPATRKPLWITEFAYSTSPPNTPAGGIPLSTQTAYVSEAFYEMWMQGVTHAFWFQIRDPLIEDEGFDGAGLYFASGAAKPGAAAFHFPFVALPATRNTLTIWGHAPIDGLVTIQRLVGSAWVTALQQPTTRGGIFYTLHRLPRTGVYRAVTGTAVSEPFAVPS